MRKLVKGSGPWMAWILILLVGAMLPSCDTSTTEDDEGGVPCGFADFNIQCGEATVGSVVTEGNDVYGYDSHFDTKGEDVIYKLTLTQTKSILVTVVPDGDHHAYPYIFKSYNDKACSNKCLAKPDPNVAENVAAYLAAPPGDYFIVVDSPKEAVPSLWGYGINVTCN